MAEGRKRARSGSDRLRAPIFFFLEVVVVMAMLAPQGSAEEEVRRAKLLPDKQELHLPEKTSFVFTCEVEDAEWLGPKNKPIEKMKNTHLSVEGNSTRKQLMLKNVTVELSGSYTCRSKSNKASSNQFVLTVIEPLSFGGPEQQTAQQSKNATLQCAPRGNPPPNVSWLRNGDFVPSNKTKFKVLKEGLLVVNVTRVDAGAYVCRAVQYLNDETVVREHVVNLTVQHQPEWHADYAKTGDLVYGYLGGLANLTCVAEAQPAGNITWLRGDKIVEVGENVTIFGDGRNSTLQLNLTEASLFGDYTCNATNALGTRARVLTLKWGARAPRPSAPQPRKAADARHALIRVDRPPTDPPPTPPTGTEGGETAAAAAPTALDLTGLRLLVRPIRAGSDVPSRVVDLPFNEDFEYVLPDLEPGSWYEVRALWRNAAGLSEESPPGEIHTSELSSAPPSTAATTVCPVAALLMACAAAILSS